MMAACVWALVIIGQSAYSALALALVAGLLWGLSRKPEKLKTNMKEA